MDQINQIINIIAISPDEREPEHLDVLINLTKEIQFFKYYMEQGKSEIHKKCCKVMVLEQYQARNVVFNIGTIEGEVGVYIKNKKGTQQQQPPSHHFEKLMQLKPRNKLQKVARILKEQNYKLETESCLIKETNTISNIFEESFKNQVKRFRLQSMQLSRFNTQENDFVQVSTLKAGSSFGELALINDRPRLATIVCSTNCKFAVIDKENFQRILKEQEEIKLIKALNLYSSIPLFEGFSTYLLKQVHWSSFRVKYKKYEKVFAQGDESDAMYIVFSGSFLIFQKFDQSKKTNLEEEEIENLNEEEFYMNYKRQTQGKKKPISNTCNYIEGTDIKICELLPYQLLGEEDLFENLPRSYNVICTSLEGELIRIKNKEFKSRILNDISAHQYLEKNVPKKRKLYAEKTMHQKMILLNNLSLLSSKQQAKSLQTKLQNGQIEEATFFKQKLTVPSSQVLKQNFLSVSPSSSQPKDMESHNQNASQLQNKISQFKTDNIISVQETSASDQRKSTIVNTTMSQEDNYFVKGESFIIPTDLKNNHQINQNQQINKVSINGGRPLSSVKQKEHNALRDYFVNVGDPLLRSCFQEELNQQNKNSTTANRKEEVMQTIFKHEHTNPQNHKYHPNAKIFTQPITEDYINVNGNIRQVLKYRNPTENSLEHYGVNNENERLQTESIRFNNTLTFIPSNLESSSPISLRKGKQRVVQTMQDLGPADLVSKIESMPQGIRSTRMTKINSMMKALQKKNSISGIATARSGNELKLSDPQNNLIKYKAISVNSLSHIQPQFNQTKSQNVLKYPSNQDSTIECQFPQNSKHMSCQSIISLKDIGKLNRNFELQLKQSDQLKIPLQLIQQDAKQPQQKFSNSFQNPFENVETSRRINSISLQQGLQSSPVKLSSASRRHTDKVLTKSQNQFHPKTEYTQNTIVEESAEKAPRKSYVLATSTITNQYAIDVINEGTQVLKNKMNNTSNSAKQLSNKNYLGRVLTTQQQRKSDVILANKFHSPQKDKSQNKKIIFSFSNLNTVKSQIEMATQTELEQLDESHKTTSNSHINLSSIQY